MNLVDLIILAIALGIDCIIVSFSQGLIFKSKRTKNSLLLALTMGFFQGIMPCFSYIGTGLITQYIEPFEKFIVFTIFMILGIKFLYEAFNLDDNKHISCIDWKCLIILGIATSIDALGAGINLRITETPLLLSSLIIGTASFVMSECGFWFGNFFKKLPSNILSILGGIILIFLAIKGIK